MRANKYIHLIGIVCLLLCITSCSVLHHPYKTPVADDAALYGQNSTVDSTTIADIPWDEYFTDSLLVQLISEGIRNNFDLQIAGTRIRVAEASLKEAKAAYFPDLSLTGEAQHLRSSNGDRGRDILGYTTNEYTLGITASWELDIWGKLNSRRKSQYAAFLGSHAYRNLIQTSLIANIATVYYSLLALDKELEINRSTVALLEENLHVMIKLKDAGLQTGAAVEQSKVTLYQIRTRIPEIEYQIIQLEHTICTLLGRTPEQVRRSSFDIQPLPQQLYYGIPAQMLARRPDVREAELTFRSAFELTNAARADFYPSITLSSGTIGYNSLNTLSQFFRPENLLLNIIGNLTQPLFNRRRLRSSLEVAQARQDEALFAFRQTVLNAGQEVTDILAEYRSSVDKNEFRTHQVTAAYNAVDYTQKLLLAGDVNYTEVLTAEEAYLTSQLEQVDDKLQQILCAVRLYRALGGGYQPN